MSDLRVITCERCGRIDELTAEWEAQLETDEYGRTVGICPNCTGKLIDFPAQ
jgi:hypothetical protein